MLVIAMGMALVVSTRELVQLRAENAKLRVETGVLKVTDRERVWVLQLKALDDMTWRWKVYLPPGRWTLRAVTEEIPKTGFPTARIGHVAAYTHVEKVGRVVQVEAAVRKAPDGRWQLITNLDGPGMRKVLRERHALTMAHKKYESGAAGANRERAFELDGPIVVLKVRAAALSSEYNYSVRPVPDEPCDGLMLWLEQDRP